MAEGRQRLSSTLGDKLNAAISPQNLDILKLAARYLEGISQQALAEATLMTDVYRLLEERRPDIALPLLIWILSYLCISKQLLDELRQHCNGGSMDIRFKDYKTIDFVLTVSCTLRDLVIRKYLSLKEIARQTFFKHYNSSNITSHIHLTQLLLDNGSIDSNNFSFLFAWLEVIGCTAQQSRLRQYCNRHGIQEPEWRHLVPQFKGFDDEAGNEPTATTNFEEIDWKYLEEAMKLGSVKTHITNAVIQGEARSGKTSLKCLLLSQPYSKLSTGPIEAPNVAYGSLSVNQFGRTGKCWTLVNDDEMFDKVLAELRSIRESMPLAKKEVESALNAIQHQITPRKRSDNPEEIEVYSSECKPSSDELEVSAKVNELLGQVSETERLSIHQEWLYFTDTGGQIQFQKLVPVFMPFASVLLLVVNLSKSLIDPASTAMQLPDQQIKVSEHSLTVEEVLKQLLSAIASSTEQFNSLTTDNSLSEYIKPPTAGKLSVIAVATHRDEYDEQMKHRKVQSIDVVEEMLNKIFDPMRQKCEIIRNDERKILHEVDGRKAIRNEFNDLVVEEIAERLSSQAYKVDVPIRWYCFGVFLRKIAKDGCGVLSLSYCQALGRQLKIPEDEVASALKFLHILNMLLYYPDSPAVADMVFVQVESLIDIIRDLVVLVCTARDKWMSEEEEIRKLSTKGFLSVEILGKVICKITQKFDGFGTKLLGLFEDLLIAVRVPEEGFFFAPALLPVKDVSNVNPFPDACKSPLLFFFKYAVPMGLFCALIVYLLSIKMSASPSSLSEDDMPTNPWKIILTDDLNWSNYCTLQNSDMKGTFVFVERLDCIEVHAEYPNAQVADVIEKAIKATIKKRRLTARAKKAFYCKCQVDRIDKHVPIHVATIDRYKHKLECTLWNTYHGFDEVQLCWLQKTTDSVTQQVPIANARLPSLTGTAVPHTSPAAPLQVEEYTLPPIPVGLNVSVVFRRYSADITSALEEIRIDESVNELHSASLISTAVYMDVNTTEGITAYQKATKVVRELQRFIDNSQDPRKYFSQTCQVLLKLKDAKLKGIVAKMTGTNETKQLNITTSHVDIPINVDTHNDSVPLIGSGESRTRTAVSGADHWPSSQLHHCQEMGAPVADVEVEDDSSSTASEQQNLLDDDAFHKSDDDEIIKQRKSSELCVLKIKCCCLCLCIMIPLFFIGSIIGFGICFKKDQSTYSSIGANTTVLAGCYKQLYTKNINISEGISIDYDTQVYLVQEKELSDMIIQTDLPNKTWLLWDNSGSHYRPRTGINYHYSDTPVYTAAGESSLLYTVSTAISDSGSFDECPFRFYLFNDYDVYNSFLKDFSSYPIQTSHCIPVNQTRQVHSIVFNLPYRGFFYVAMAIDEGININVTITPHLKIFDVSNTPEMSCALNRVNSFCNYPISSSTVPSSSKSTCVLISSTNDFLQDVTISVVAAKWNAGSVSGLFFMIVLGLPIAIVLILCLLLFICYYFSIFCSCCCS